MDWNYQLAVFFRLLSEQALLQSSQTAQEAYLRSHDQFYRKKWRERSAKFWERRVVNRKEGSSMINISGCGIWLYWCQQNYIRDCESWIRCLVKLYLRPDFHRSISKSLTGWIQSCHYPSFAGAAASTLSATVHWALCQECAKQIFPQRPEVALHSMLFAMGVPTHRAHHPRPPRHWCNFD